MVTGSVLLGAFLTAATFTEVAVQDASVPPAATDARLSPTRAGAESLAPGSARHGAVGGLQGASSQATLDTASLATGPFAELRTRYDRRFLFLRFNVLDVRVRFGPETTDRLRRLVEEEGRSRTLEDSAALTAAHATDAFAELEFLRNVRLDEFVDATRENLDRVARAELISEADAGEIGRQLPEWFDFLRDRGIREGDRLLYRIRGDTLRTLFIQADGTWRLDQTDVGPERRLAVLGGYFAPGADFREGLLESLYAER